MKSILVIEDDPDIRELLRYNLTREGYNISIAVNGKEGLDLAQKGHPDLILLDLMLPQVSGIEVCKRLRETPATRYTPIIMLTAKGEESDVVFGLGVGADDYIVKPFSMNELVARVYSRFRALGRSQQQENKDVLTHGKVVIDKARFQVTVAGSSIPMTLAEFRLFTALVSRPGVVLTRDILLDAVTGGDGVLVDRNIDVHVRSIRKKLGEERDLIETVRGVGYKFKESE